MPEPRRELGPGLRRGDEKNMTDVPKPCDASIETARNRPRAMRPVPLLLLGLALPLASQAVDARWTVLHEDAAGGQYIDLASVQRTGAGVDVWMLVDHVDVRRIPGVRHSESNSALAKVRIDCAGRRSGILAIELHADRRGEGDVVYQHARDTPDMVPVESDPSMLRALELVCG
jgi:hypothetical protein